MCECQNQLPMTNNLLYIVNLLHLYYDPELENYVRICSSSGECSARGQRNFRSFLRSQDLLPVWDPLPVGQIWGQIWGHVT